jgi:two-component system, chemotaxis family, protein-glutamate methylesterase/glutaminase
VIAVVLSGTLDDGTAGVAAVKQRGGIAIAQDPDSALFSSMPRSAIENVGVDHVVTLEELPRVLATVSREPAVAPQGVVMSEQIDEESDVVEMTEESIRANKEPGPASGFTCPECHGALFELHDGELTRFRCRVGHAYSVDTLMAEQTEAVEAALWSAVVALEERAALARKMSVRARERRAELSGRQFDQRADEAMHQATVIQKLLLQRRNTEVPQPAPNADAGMLVQEPDGNTAKPR